jgi:uncharacterized membrane protein YeiH
MSKIPALSKATAAASSALVAGTLVLMHPTWTRALDPGLRPELLRGAGVVWGYFDVVASTMWAITGAFLGARRGFDLSGMFAMALVSSTGGGLLRDGVFLQAGPPNLVRSPLYIAIAGGAAFVVWLLGGRVQRYRFLERTIMWADALGLGGFAVVGVQLALGAGVSIPGAMLIGVVNAVGGSLLRSVLTLQTPEVFRPGELTALAAFAGCVVYVALVEVLHVDKQLAAAPAAATIVTLRLTSVHYRLRTRAAIGFAVDRLSKSNSRDAALEQLGS